MARKIGFVPYVAGVVSSYVPLDMAVQTTEELKRVDAAFANMAGGQLLVPYAAEPAQITPLMLVYADGANWNPGSGEGVYIRNLTNTSWTFLGSGGGGGGLTYWTEASATAAPNDTVNVSSFIPVSAGANADAALLPKGTGAILAAIPDSTSTSGNKRGARAVDLQTERNNAAQVASGANSAIVAGRRCKASAQYGGVFAAEEGANDGYASFIGGGSFNSITSGANYSASIGGLSNTINNALYCVIGGTSCSISSGSHYSTAFGRSNSITSPGGFAAGYNNTISGTYSSVGGGELNTASGAYSVVPGGRYGHTRGIHGAMAFASHTPSSTGQSQWMKNVLYVGTTDATATVAKSNSSTAGTTNQLVLVDGSAYLVRGMAIARQNTTGDSKSWEFTAHIKRGSGVGTTALVGSATVTVIAADAGAAAWTLAVTADTTNGGLAVTVTGEASKTLRWTVDMNSVQVVG